jgi:hypothetical protein
MDEPVQPSLLYSPEHQQAIGRIVLAASGMEATVATILARLWDPPESAIRDLAGLPSGRQRELLRGRVEQKLPRRLREEVLAWVERVGQEAHQRNRIVHATWYRVDKPSPESVAFAHYGREAATAGYATVVQITLTDLHQIGVMIDSVAFAGLLLLGKVEDYLAGVLPALLNDGPPRRQPNTTDTDEN